MPKLEEILGDELLKEHPAFGAQRTFDYIELEDGDEKAILRCIRDTVGIMSKISPEIAALFSDQEEAVLKYAGIAKAIFPETKEYTYPSQGGNLGVLPIIPQALRYIATPSATSPAFTSYATNLWEITTTAGTAAYFLGSAAQHYRTSNVKGSHSFLCILKDGIIEIGSTPSVQQFHLETEAYRVHGIWAAHPITELPLEKGTTIYQYNTVASIPVDHTTGTRFGFMPSRSGISLIKLLGFCFFEHDFLPGLTWRT